MAAGTGLLLVLLGIELTLARPEGEFATPGLNRYRDALGAQYRRGGYLLVGLGAVVLAGAFVLPLAAMVVASLAVLVVFGGMAVFALTRA